MSRRRGTILHWLGALVAALAIAGAVVWNVETYQARQAAQHDLRALPPEIENREAALAAAFAQQRASTQGLRRSVTFGGVLVLGGLIVYGLGWVARYASRQPQDKGRQRPDGGQR